MDGNTLKKIRQEKGYSLTKLSKLTTISKSYLSLLERGIQHNPSIEIIEKIAKALGVNISHLIQPTENKKSENSMIKLEINLLQESINQEKLDQIKQLITLLGNE